MTYHDLRALFVKRFNIPKERVIREAVKSFTIAERAVFYFFAGLFILTGTLLLFRVNTIFKVAVPIHGGTLTEGIIGNPRFINPILAISEADKSLVSLIYSGLVRTTPAGETRNDLADSITVSDDGLTYTARLSDNAVFHDGAAVTADDVVFTISKIKDENLKSPLFADWSAVGVEKVDDRTVTFTLKKPYVAFIDNLTVGILPKHIWNNVSDDEFSFSQFNALPVGSGPYEIASVERDSGGIPNYYDLKSFAGVLGGVPYIDHMVFKFYANANTLLDAYAGGDIDALAGISPDDATVLKNERVLSGSLPRIFGVFFNENHSRVLLEKEVRQALDLAAPKERITKEVFHGFATSISGPLPEKPSNIPTADIETRITEAKELLAQSGWVPNPDTGILEKKIKNATITLSFSISTSDTPELKAVLALLKESWEKLGAKVEDQVFDPGDLNQNVIRPRHYDALLFGEVVGRDKDIYPFWHSSERNDPGLNIALYANSKADKLLENLRTESDSAKREADYAAFASEVRTDIPAVFLYSPSFLYIVPPEVQRIELGELTEGKDRFQDVRNWYIETDHVWQIFMNQTKQINNSK